VSEHSKTLSIDFELFKTIMQWITLYS
jgi:hypothetical protein